jgi:hydroxymethylglutaryl-CoA reductase
VKNLIKKGTGFSKLTKKEKTDWLEEKHLHSNINLNSFLKTFQHPDINVQKVLDDFSENTLCNFPMPYGVAPHFVINDKEYCIPMVIEESSVVAAASNAAKFWKSRGGIKADVLDTTKLGHVHFFWFGDNVKLVQFFNVNKEKLEDGCKEITGKMESRGGGILSINLIDETNAEKGFYKIEVKFETCDSMGANFINSVLEKVASIWKYLVANSPFFLGEEKKVDVVLRILSNYTPDCKVKVGVSCDIQSLGYFPNGTSPSEFANKFYKAVRIAKIDPYRATTHNKGIFNGIDAVVLATGNDFRAIEACGHTYASSGGQYKGLSTCTLDKGKFEFYMELPLALGTVGGLTNIHPLAKLSLEILGNPDARELMKIVASTGLMQNFAALRSLVTTGIQQGHMKMHLSNILNQLQATEKEFKLAMEYFTNKLVSFSNVREYLDKLRKLDIR